MAAGIGRTVARTPFFSVHVKTDPARKLISKTRALVNLSLSPSDVKERPG